MSNAVAARKDERARRKAERMMEKQREAAEHDLPRSMRPSPITKTITVIVLVVALIYFLFPIYWAIIASTKTPSQLTSSNGLWFAVGLDQIPDAIATNYSKLMGWTRGQFWRWVLNSLIYSGVSALIGTIISVMAGYATAKFNFRGKAIAIGVPYDGDFWDFFSGKVPEQALPVGTVLTIAASGSEGSPDSIITNEKTLEKNGAEADCLRPCFSVLDPALTESLPAYQTACGITDIMAHTFERYFTNTPDVEVTDRMLEGVLLAMLHEGRRVMEDPHNYEARANIMWAGMVCHNDIMGVGRQQDWNSHHLEHVLSAKYDCAHGAGLAVIMPAWMRYCAEHGGEKRLAQMAVRVFGCQMDFDDPKRTALEGIEAFRAFLRSLKFKGVFASPLKLHLTEGGNIGFLTHMMTHLKPTHRISGYGKEGNDDSGN